MALHEPFALNYFAFPLEIAIAIVRIFSGSQKSLLSFAGAKLLHSLNAAGPNHGKGGVVPRLS